MSAVTPTGAATAAAAAVSAAPLKDGKREQKEIEGNKVFISATKSMRFYADIALRMFTTNEDVELHGLGAAVAPTIDLGQHLLGLKKAQIIKISTSSVAGSSSSGRKPEVVVILKRTGIPTLPDQLTDDEQKLVQITEDQDHDD